MWCSRRSIEGTQSRGRCELPNNPRSLTLPLWGSILTVADRREGGCKNVRDLGLFGSSFALRVIPNFHSPVSPTVILSQSLIHLNGLRDVTMEIRNHTLEGYGDNTKSKARRF